MALPDDLASAMRAAAARYLAELKDKTEPCPTCGTRVLKTK